MITIQEEKHATVFYHSTGNFMEFIWDGFVNTEQYKATVIQGYKATIKHKAQAWLSDTRKGKIIAPEGQKWMIEDFVPNHLMHTDVRTVAFVVPEDIFRKVYVNKLTSLFGDKFKIEYFETREQAETWLEDQLVIAKK